MGSLSRKLVRDKKRSAYKRFRKEFALEREHRARVGDASMLLGKTPRFDQWETMIADAMAKMIERQNSEKDITKDVPDLEWSEEATAVEGKEDQGRQQT
jgi:hypothetical protein